MENVQTSIDRMKQEIDALQVTVMAGKSPWYKSPSIMISALALLFSFGTTAVSFHRAAQDEIRSGRAELRGILQRKQGTATETGDSILNYPTRQ